MAAGRAGRGSPRRLRSGGRELPYLLLLPALLLELLIHIVPMVVGVGISFKKLTQFYIRNWIGLRGRAATTTSSRCRFDSPIGEALLHSFWVTVAFTVLSVGLSLAARHCRGASSCRPFRGRALSARCSWSRTRCPSYAAVITWSFMLQRDNGLVNHVLVDELHLTRRPAVLADRRQQLLARWSSSRSGGPGRSPSWC